VARASEVVGLRSLGIGVAIVVGLCAAYAVAHLALIELGQEIVVLHKRGSDGTVRETRLWIVDDGGYAWLHAGGADDYWIRQLATDPILEVERAGETRRYRALPVPEADATVHSLLRQKYGFADRVVRFWYGTHTESGLASGGTCWAVPVRLEPL
jgi:hypothetical protein